MLIMTEWYEDKVKGKRNREQEKEIRAQKVKEAERHSKGYGQAVVKVYSYSHGVASVKSHAKYLTRDSELPMEVGGKDGDENILISDPDEVKEILEEWSDDFDTFKNSRDVANITLSAPVGSDRGGVEKAARSFSREYFSHTEYMFVVHNDTNHPHAHLMVKMRDNNNEKIRLDKKQLKQMRETFAEKLRDNGINVGSSYRTDRGVFKKPFPQMAKYIRERVGEWEADRQLKEQVKDLTKKLIKGEKMEKPKFLTAMEKKHKDNIEFYGELRDASNAAGDSKQAELYQKTIDGFEKPETQVIKLSKEVVKKMLKEQASGQGKGKDKDIER